nr:DUF2326 domain-containing protein [Clostridioides sp.]
MLIEVKSNILRKGIINFHEGLNVILGDEYGSNSIGKSTLLMILDFIFGGSTYLEHNKDVLENIGDHTFFFTFKFNGKLYKFARDTEDNDNIYVCDNEYRIIEEETITVKEYTVLLSKHYNINYSHSTFRSLISLFSRVWGKGNYDTRKPLNIHIKSKDKDSIENIIKLYNRYDTIYSINKKIKDSDKELKTLRSAKKLNYVPKITETKYKKNLKEISDINEKLHELDQKLKVKFIEIPELINDELLELNNHKDILLSKKSGYLNKMERLDYNNLNYNKINGEQFDELKNIFPDVNIDRLGEIEEFHSKIFSFLKEDIEKSKGQLEKIVRDMEESLIEINNQISQVLEMKNIPKSISNGSVDLYLNLNKLSHENEMYLKETNLKAIINDEKEKLNEKSKVIINDLKSTINTTMKEIYKCIYKDSTKAPSLELSIDKYSFLMESDTGTGKTYAGILSLDLAIFKTSNLPFIIHDSILFKNMGDNNFANLINEYCSFKKQIFIAIDKIDMYNDECKTKLENNHVIKLNKEETLFKKIWNR